MPLLTIHLLGNAHLDPVWLWDWREGLNTGLNTCRTILELMDEYPDLTFNRGEAAVYEHIEKTDPATFARIKRQVEAGRWDVIGGTFIQPDDNLPATEAFTRQYLRGAEYLTSRFGKAPTVAWSADCFGHAAGMPEVLAAAGMKYFAFTRPAQGSIPLSKAAFWWVGASGSRILACRPRNDWYGTNRDTMTWRLDQTLAGAKGDGLHHVACLYGLGDHGGGPTRRHLADIKAWISRHPEVRVIQSTFHAYFAALEGEISTLPAEFLPVHQGELNFFARGCYSSVARFKFPYRKAEASLLQAERTATVVAAKLGTDTPDLSAAWDATLFNAFHDILPGSSIERGFDEQIQQLGMIQHTAISAQFAALNALACKMDIKVEPVADADMPTGVPVLLWNPHPHAFDGFVEMEICLDDRPNEQYKNERRDLLPVRILDDKKQPLPFQLIATESMFYTSSPWRRRAVVPVKIPAMGWSVAEMAWVEGAPPPAAPTNTTSATARGSDTNADAEVAIENGLFAVRAAAGTPGVKIERNGKPLLSADGLAAAVFEDPYGSWGGAEDDVEAIHIRTLRENLLVSRAIVTERGPWRSALWVQLAGKNSRIELTFHLYAGRDAVDVSARVLMNDRSAQLKLLFPTTGGAAQCDTLASSVTRPAVGNVPAHRWIRVINAENSPVLGFASDAISSFFPKADGLEVTLVRTSRYANDEASGPTERPWVPAMDLGEHRFKFLITDGDDRLAALARLLEQPPVAQVVSPGQGTLAPRGSLFEMSPATFDLLALKGAEDGKGFILRVQERSGKPATPVVTFMGDAIELTAVESGKIASWRIKHTAKGWAASPCDAAERKVPKKRSPRRVAVAT